MKSILNFLSNNANHTLLLYRYKTNYLYMKGYNDFNSVEEFREYYHLPAPITEAKEEEGRVINDDEDLPVIYANLEGHVENIFKHIIIFTNNRDPKDNKTLKNIYECIDECKKAKTIVPELHVFVAAKMIVDDDEENIILDDGTEHFEINKEFSCSRIEVSWY